MNFKPRKERYCKDCAYFHGELTAQDMELLDKMLEQYDAQLMLKSWVEMGQVKIPGGTSVVPEKAKAVEVLRRSTGFCPREKTFVSAVDLACYAWKQRGKGVLF